MKRVTNNILSVALMFTYAMVFSLVAESTPSKILCVVIPIVTAMIQAMNLRNKHLPFVMNIIINIQHLFYGALCSGTLLYRIIFCSNTPMRKEINENLSLIFAGSLLVLLVSCYVISTRLRQGE